MPVMFCRLSDGIFLQLNMPLHLCSIIVVNCALGTYWKDTTCVPCPIGTYGDIEGALQCTQCPDINGHSAITQVVGSMRRTDCKETCQAGYYFERAAARCQACGYGFYQPSEGAFSCFPCPVYMTTHTVNATFKSQCFGRYLRLLYI